MCISVSISSCINKVTVAFTAIGETCFSKYFYNARIAGLGEVLSSECFGYTVCMYAHVNVPQWKGMPLH